MTNERLRELSEKYGLTGADFHMQKYSNKTVPFMLKSGVDTIEAIEQIETTFEPVEGLCIPGEHVTLKVKAKWGDRPSYETFGEASADNTRVNFLTCMAEKRGRARAVLTLTGFAKEGVYSIDEKWDEKDNL